MTHAELVDRAVRWLRGSRRCVLVLREYRNAGGEEPDALGWTARGTSVLVECKASRSDFYADRKKPWRRLPEFGLGTERWYMTPPGLVVVLGGPLDDLPDGWGLAEVEPRHVRVLIPARRVVYPEGPRREIATLVNAARRLGPDGWGRSQIAYLAPGKGPVDTQEETA